MIMEMIFVGFISFCIGIYVGVSFRSGFRRATKTKKEVQWHS